MGRLGSADVLSALIGWQVGRGKRSIPAMLCPHLSKLCYRSSGKRRITTVIIIIGYIIVCLPQKHVKLETLTETESQPKSHSHQAIYLTSNR